MNCYFKSIDDIWYKHNNEKIILGKGGYGKVKLIYHKTNSHKLFAMK